MFLSNLSIKRPVFATVMMLALVTLGLFSWRRLPIDMMPDVEIPVLSILTEYPGASPETVEREVTKRIEEAVNPISGVKHVQSVSREGLSSVIVEFNLEVKINDVEVPVGFLEDEVGRGTVPRLRHETAHAPQCRRQRPPDERLVINDEHSRTAISKCGFFHADRNFFDPVDPRFFGSRPDFHRAFSPTQAGFKNHAKYCPQWVRR